MSSLARYKKGGGFVQLLSLIETFGPQKKDKFLEMIEAENKVWGTALRDKMLTLERISLWPDQAVLEVFKNLPPRHLAIALATVKDDLKTRLLVFFSVSERRRLEEIYQENVPKPEDIATNMVKIIEMARKMLHDGTLRAERFDDRLLIPEDYETKLEAHGHQSTAQKMTGDSGVPAHHPSPTADAPASPLVDLGQLQKTLGHVLKENKTLKEEVRVLREKLDQIKRIA
jgi:hypothetical protein